MQILENTKSVMGYLANELGGILILLSFIIIPLLMPAFGIVLMKRNRLLFNRLTGKTAFCISIIILIFWLYPFLKNEWNQMLMNYVRVLAVLTVFHAGVYIAFSRNIWIKIVGLFLSLTGLYGYMLLMVGRIYSGI